ncbi:uncharacterized protein LOC120421689 [Culex pipiens pallens]|uniref:uncharacterized protein LOC120421689 n=1 Tax=Culex pipiens pallens TaxID=42434 RepID=UPI001953CEB5|nr:uncharacterized protein LOC120421689 [Culex pipiens pallens]
MLSVKLTLLFGLVAITLGCNVPTKHYSTMKCTPINKKGSECPERFDCPSITNHVNSKCYFNGDTYALSEQVPNEKVAPFCSALCYCRSGSPFAQFRCTHVDCAEFFHRFDYDNCIRTYKPNGCCSAGQVCGEDKKKLAKCTVNGDDFLAGQRMHPNSNKCLTCICHEGFNEANIGSDPYCYESTCGFELFYAKQAYGGAAPVYYEDRCCPWEWRMPKDSDKLIKGSSKNTDKQLQCQYGRLAMNVGDRLETEVTDQYTYECSCQIPPLAQCVMAKLQKE